jgi:hypothetical protein
VTRRFLQISVAAALIIAVGGHWAILQSVAWVGMAVTYSKDASLSVALKKTFDGQHPCQLCKAVAEGKQAEKKKEARKLEIKLDFWSPDGLAGFLPLTPDPVLPGQLNPRRARSESPPTPPPRLA